MMHSPSHPGQIIRCLIEEAEITVTKAAQRLNVSRSQLTRLITEKSGISPEMALRLEAVFGSTADAWMRLQSAWELSQVRKQASQITKGLKPLDTSDSHP